MEKKEEKFMEDAEIAELYKRDRKLANEKVVEKYSRYVYFFLHRTYPTYQRDFADMFQHGMIGILKAMETYNPSKGKFSTYSTPFIRSECSAYVRFLQGEPSEHYARINREVRKAATQLESRGERATAENVARESGVSARIAEREMKVEYMTEPIESADKQEGPDVFSGALDQILCETLLSEVSEKQRKIILLKVVDGISFRKISAMMGEQDYIVRREYYSGIQKIREAFSAE